MKVDLRNNEIQGGDNSKQNRFFIYAVEHSKVNDTPHETIVKVRKFRESDTIFEDCIKTYTVAILKDPEDIAPDLTVRCDCPGFRIQRYSKLLHKHVVVAREHMLALSHGQPIRTKSIYRIKGRAGIEFVHYIIN